MKVVILAGGLGTRLAEETVAIPKPMVEIGGRPILWHIMKHYAPTGSTSSSSRSATRARSSSTTSSTTRRMNGDITVDLGDGHDARVRRRRSDDWTVHLVDTGLDTDDRRPRAAPGAVHRRRDLHAHLRRRRRRRRPRAPAGLPPRATASSRPSPRCARRRASAASTFDGDRRRAVHREAADGRGLDQRRLHGVRAAVSSTISTATTTSLEIESWSGSPPTGSWRPTGTRASGSAWTRCVTSTARASCGHRRTRPGRAGERGGRGRVATDLPIMRRRRRASLDLGRLAARQRAARCRALVSRRIVFPLDVCFCPRCCARADRRDRAAGTAVPRLRLCSSFSRHHARARARTGRDAGRSPRLGADEPGHRGGEQRRLPAAVLRRARRPRARHRAGGKHRASCATAKGIATLVEFFDARARPAARARKDASADVIHAHNVFAHVPDPNGSSAGLKRAC